jgi:nitrile hydratase beta subunit
MNGIHDVGGMDGFGPVVREENEPVFHEAWEGRLRAIHQLVMRKHKAYHLDESRYYVERIHPVYYLSASYYQLWLLRTERQLIDKGILTEEEIRAREAELRPGYQSASTLLPYRKVLDLVYSDKRAYVHSTIDTAVKNESDVIPGFSTGMTVRVKQMSPLGHNRAPRYVRGKRGVIEAIHGTFALPDVKVENGTDLYQTVYRVRFDAQELWGEDASPQDKVYIEMWEDYLEPGGVSDEQQ